MNHDYREMETMRVAEASGFINPHVCTGRTRATMEKNSDASSDGRILVAG